MARKDVFKGTLEALINPTDSPARPTSKSILQSGALGAVEAGLARGLQLLELDPDEIAQSEFADRLEQDPAEMAALVESMRAHGQQIPILVQRGASGYKVIYGRRRLAAARALGIRVRALVTQMDDDQRIIAQGIENSVRQDLSFIEKALFAQRLRNAGVAEETVKAALNIDIGQPKATTLSSMKMVVETLGEELIEAIGRAPGIGRPRWRTLADLLRAKGDGVDRAALVAGLSRFADANPGGTDPSDLRFKRVLAMLAAPPAPPPATPPAPALGVIRRSRSAVTLTVLARDNPKFHAWLQDHAEAALQALHDQWSQTEQPQPGKEAR